MLSVIAKNLIRRWRLSALFAGAMVSIIFCGLLIGTIFGGFLCDRYGRRMPILVTYAGITVFLVASLASPDILLLITAKFMLGLSLGFGVPAANAMVCECCPASHRSNVYSMTMVLFSLGQMYSAVVIWTMSPDLNHDELHWRAMLGLAVLLPFTLVILSHFFLLESPHWLLGQGRYSEAKEVVWQMAQYKGNVPSDVFEDIMSSIRTNSDELDNASEASVATSGTGRLWCCCPTDAQGWDDLKTNVAVFFYNCKDDGQRLSLLFSEK